MHSAQQALDQKLMPGELMGGREEVSEGEYRDIGTETEKCLIITGAFKTGIKLVLDMQKSAAVQLCS